MGFQSGRAPLATDRRSGCDEAAAKRAEGRLVDLGEAVAEAGAKVPPLAEALGGGLPLQLLQRIDSHLSEAAADMSRLLVEARKELRPE